MQFQDLDPTRKLPFIRSSTTKILILVSVVVLLMAANFYVIFKGKTKNGSEVATVTGEEKKENTAPSGSVVYDVNKDESVLVLMSFLKYLKDGNKTEAEKLISVYSSPDFFQTFISENISREDITFNPIGFKYSQQKNFSYVTMEISKGSSKEYYKFVLIKNNSKWEIVSFEKI